ncbi:MAG: DUF58 domain-containing protein [Deltaproteobacteria bacterium]|nr:DUF58 domain-containing protein [Deltaproteobacteria bacterium]
MKNSTEKSQPSVFDDRVFGNHTLGMSDLRNKESSPSATDRLRRVLSRVVSKTRTILQRQPFTSRGLLFAGGAALILYFFGVETSDLVAYTLGGGILFLCLFAAACSGLLYLRLRRELRFEAHLDPSVRVSHVPISAGLLVWEASFYPFFQLEITREFEHPGAKSPAHVLRGGVREDGKTWHLLDFIVFPHRGAWSLVGIRCTISDALGLSSVTWTHPISESYEIAAPRLSIRALPIIASSSRAGDEMPLTRERTGDPFDIKAYDPSDGVTRILWKTYARSGELVVRRPEPAVIPEGEIAVFLVAGREDDHVVGAFFGYLDQLRDQNISVLFGTDGLWEVIAGDGSDRLLSEDSEIRSAAIRTAWSRSAGTANDFHRYLSALQNNRHGFTQIVVFAPQSGETDWAAPLLRAASGVHAPIATVFVPERFRTFLGTDRLPDSLETLYTPRGFKRPKRRSDSPHKALESAARIERAGGLTYYCELNA